VSLHTVSLDRALVVFYAAMAAAALVATGWHNVTYFTSDGDTDLTGYVGAAFANSASSALTLDLAFVGVVCLAFILVEGRRVGLSGWWLAALFVGSAAVAIAVTFPLFLMMRSIALQRNSPSTQ
jgi:hypothetical protein